MRSRISKLKGFDNVLLGRDLLNIFKEGHVYDVKKYGEQIIITDLCKHAIFDNYIGAGISGIALDGSYCLTQEEDIIQHGKQSSLFLK